MTRISALPCAIAAAVLLSGCGDRQSVLNPKGPYAAELAQLSWLLLAFGAFVLLLVVAAIVVAIRGPERARTALASARAVAWAGIVFPARRPTMQTRCISRWWASSGGGA
jgi:heme/copper-type cytochrome/quinol oxidase subunit 2